MRFSRPLFANSARGCALRPSLSTRGTLGLARLQARTATWPSCRLARHAPVVTASFSTNQQWKSAQLSTGAAGRTPTPKSGQYTTAFALFEALWEAGVTTCFVNVGSDHPSIIEAIVRGKKERPDRWPRMITCPSEVIAISMADGYARVTGRPQAVIVHVDVGTQALGQGVHNASAGRAPVFIFAGLCPYTEAGELPGSRTEYMHWLQEAPDQSAIVRQYCRYTGEIRTGVNVKQSVARALQFASTAPKGPVYLTCARETLAQEIEPYSLSQDQWVPVGPSSLPNEAVHTIAEALIHAERPIVVTGYSGRDRRCPELLVALAEQIPGLRVHDTGGSDMCFPFSHRASEGFRLGSDECTADADVILVLDCDVPWIPARNQPRKDARIYHVDIDPLNQRIPVSFFPGHGRWKADCFTALMQLNKHIESDSSLRKALQDPKYLDRWKRLAKAHQARIESINAIPLLGDDKPLSPHNVGRLLRQCLPSGTTFVVEAVTNSQIISDQLQPSQPGSWINCGGTGIGWSNGAALGVKMAVDDQHEKLHGEGTDGSAPSLVCQVVGDGSYMCAAPSSAAWVARKYNIPIITVVLNNGGWNAPRASTELVYPDGLNKFATNEELNISFRPSPNYAALAKAAAGSDLNTYGPNEESDDWMMGTRVKTVKELRNALRQAVPHVQKQHQGVLVEALMEQRE